MAGQGSRFEGGSPYRPRVQPDVEAAFIYRHRSSDAICLAYDGTKWRLECAG